MMDTMVQANSLNVDKKLSLLLALWVLDKIVMIFLLCLLN